MVLIARITVRRLTDDYEILVVDDGSEDHTAEVLAELQRLVPELRVLRHPQNRGYGAALRTGFAAASKDLVFYTDGDAQFDPREMKVLADSLDEDVDYVTGYKISRADPILRVALGRPYHWAVRLAFGLKLRDIDCDFRLLRRRALRQVELTETNGSLCIELLKKLEDAGFRFREVPVHHYPRAYGRSQYYTPRRVLRAYRQLFGLWLKLVVRKSHLRAPVASMEGATAQPAQDEQNAAS